MDSPLDLLEIKTLIGEYLEREDIYSCRLVNKEWCSSFNPFFWRKVNCARRSLPIPPTLKDNFHSIHELDLSGITHRDFYKLPSNSLHRMKKLTLTWSRKGPVSQSTRRFLPHFLREQCTNITTLYVADGPAENSVGFWKSVARSCSRLRRLDCTVSTSISQEAFVELWKAICSTGVEEVWFNGHESQEWKAINMSPEKLTFVGEGGLMVPKVKVFGFRSLMYTSSGILRLVHLCPELCRLSCGPMNEYQLDKICTGLKHGRWKDLESIKFDSGDCTDELMARTVEAMPRLHTVLFNATSLGTLFFQALQDHGRGFSELQVLDVGRCTEFKSYMALVILEEFTRLTAFSAPVLEIRDMMASEKPWKCASTLKTLHVPIIFSRPIIEREDRDAVREEIRFALGRISRLRELEYLGIRVDASLSNGLGQLDGLGKLRSGFLWSRWMDDMDVEWVLDHWPRWSGLVTFMNSREFSPEIEARLKLRGFSWGDAR